MWKHTGTFGLAVVLFGVLAGFGLYRHTENTVRNCYAQWWVADMVIAHLGANQQAWPRSWDDLADDYKACTQRSGAPWSFEELKQRVTVDWNAQTDSLRNQPPNDNGPPFRAIWLSDGTSSHWKNREPNSMIANYFRRHPQPSK